MNKAVQVDHSHYDFSSYMLKGRWSSTWHQIDEVMKFKPQSVLEVGPGLGIFKAIASKLKIAITSVDFDPSLEPDITASITDLPVSDDQFDVACAFQVLEHLPYDQALEGFRELARVATRGIVISLPDSQIAWRYRFQIPKLGAYDFLVPRPVLRRRPAVFDGQHYWEINKRGYELKKVVRDLEEVATLVRTFRVPELPYHRFLAFEARQ